MSLEQFIKEKAAKSLRNKLTNIAHEFNNLIPNLESTAHAPDYRAQAESHGSNILTDCFGVDFPDWVSHSSAKSVAGEYVQLLMLAFDIHVDSESVSRLRKSKLSHITDNIMEKMEAAMTNEEPETSITIKGRGIKIDE